MAEQMRYTTPAAFRHAAEARLRSESRRIDHRSFAELRREFIYQRFLARVFQPREPSAWVLKGGIGLLARLPGARYSRDIDLLHLTADPIAAEAELREVGRRDIGEHLRFEVDRATPLSVSDALRLKMSAYLGTGIWDNFDVDVSLERHFVAALEQVAVTPVVELAGLSPLPPFQCYPLADQIADKLAAMYERHGRAGVPSSRFRDLVDLVLIVGAQDLDAGDLKEAMGARQRHSRSPVDLPPSLHSPGSHWPEGYREQARRSSLHADLHDYGAALLFVAGCLNPVLSGKVRHGTWDPVSRTRQAR